MICLFCLANRAVGNECLCPTCSETNVIIKTERLKVSQSVFARYAALPFRTQVKAMKEMNGRVKLLLKYNRICEFNLNDFLYEYLAMVDVGMEDAIPMDTRREVFVAYRYTQYTSPPSYVLKDENKIPKINKEGKEIG